MRLEPLVGCRDSVPQLDRWLPPKTPDLGGAHQLPWRAIRLGEIMNDLALEAHDVTNKLNQF